MIGTVPMTRDASRTLERLYPRLKTLFQGRSRDWAPFERRLVVNFPRLFDLLRRLYGQQYDFFWHLETMLETAARAWLDRPGDLRELDERREADPQWFQSNRMIGAVCYVDLFAGDLKGVRERIPYFRELGVTYLHLMPLLRSPPGDNDGGYAVSSYRDVARDLGTMEELRDLAAEFRANGISLVLDFVFNHTADDHAWAERAKAGDPDYQDFYRMFDDRTVPDQYQPNLRDIFPDRGFGCFTWRPDVAGVNGGKWVWTTFYTFQWDLNFGNPAVFRAMLEEMLFLANQGVEVLRLDAVPFLWKRMGTTCENLEEAHWIIQAYNALVRIAAPATMFKSEAIVHPDEVAKYVGAEEAQLSYYPMLMVLLWNSLATREVRLTRHALAKRSQLPSGTSWVTYIRGHDDIGWGFADEDAAELGMNGFDHRQFLNAFYTGRFPGSFARGLPFQENPVTRDARISGTQASLAGLEKALQEGDEREIDLAVRRILLMHGIIMTIGGIPLIYVGDEVGLTNDYAFTHDPRKATDNRWVHRPRTDWALQESWRAAGTADPHGRIFEGIKSLIRVRRGSPVFGGAGMEITDIGNDHVLAYLRHGEGAQVIVLANFTEAEQPVSGNEIRLRAAGYEFRDLVTGQTVEIDETLVLAPYQLMCLSNAS